MAEVTGLRNSALPYPTYAAPYGIVLVILDADGDPVTGAAGLDSEVSLNGDTFADCTNEATEIGSSGLYSLLLTAAEMTADVVTVQVKTSTSGAKTTPIVMYPRKLVSLRSGTAAGGASGSITLDSGASAVDDFYNGCLVVGTLDGAVEARIITDYTGSTKVAAVTPNWNTTPDSDDTFIIYLPEGVQINQANTTLFGGAAGTFASGIPETKVASIANDAITAAAIANNAIGASEIADGAIDAATFASGALDAVWSTAARTLTAFDSSFKTGYALSSAGVQAIWDALTSALTTVGSIGKLLVDNINATISSRLATSGYTTPPTVGAIADQVWEETLADHSGTAGSTAEQLAAAGAAGDPWATALPGAYTSGQAGKIVGDNLNATVGSRATQTSVDDLPTNAELATAFASADDAVLAAIAALNNLSAAQVTAAVPTATQNADALLKRDLSAVTGEAARSALNALRFLRNKWSIAGAVLTVTKEDDTTTAWTGAVTQTAGDPVSEIDPA